MSPTSSPNLILSRIDGLSSLIHSASPTYKHPIPETVSPLLESLLKDSPFTHVVSAHSAFAKSLLPRVAAKIDSPPISDITSLEHGLASNSTTFTRPIYAGNAIATVKAPSSVTVKFFTVRTTEFKAAGEGGSAAELKQVNSIEVNSPTKHVKTELAKSGRPNLTSAPRVVSGGRALRNAKTCSCNIERCRRLFVYPTVISTTTNLCGLGLNIGAFKESTEHILGALPLQRASGDGSEPLWSTLREPLLNQRLILPCKVDLFSLQ